MMSERHSHGVTFWQLSVSDLLRALLPYNKRQEALQSNCNLVPVTGQHR